MKAQGIKRIVLLLGILLLSGGCCLTVKAEVLNGWQEEDGKLYWYEDGVRQGYDPEKPDYRGKEILSSFDTGNVKDMSNMFAGTKALTRITVGKAWVIQPDTEVNEMFQDCGTDCVTKK